MRVFLTFLSTVDVSPCFQSEDIELIWSYLSTLIKDATYEFVPTSPTSYNILN